MKKFIAPLLAAFALAAAAQQPFLSVASSPSGTNGTVTSVSVTPSNGVTGTVTTATTTPAIALTLGNITPTTVNKVTITAPATGSTLTISDGKTLAATNSITLSGTDGKTYTFPAQTATVAGYVGSTTYASLVASWPCNGTWSGFKAFVTDWGVNGTDARCNGTRWLPTNGQTVLKRMGVAVTGITNTETIVAQVQFPVNVLQVGDVILVRMALSKTGATDLYQLSARMGTAGTTADNLITGLSSFTAMTASGLSGGVEQGIKILGTTSVQRLGNTGNSTSAYSGASAVAISAATTGLADMSSNAVWVTITVKSSSTTDTVGVQEVTIIHEAS